MQTTPRPRPGGRASRVRAAIYAATIELLTEEDWGRITLGRVAQRAGVTPSTVYRRWQSLPELISAVVDDRLSAGSPLPDTGTLAEDVRAHARGIAADLSGADGQLLLRAAALVGPGGAQPRGPGHGHGLSGRTRQVMEMLERAARRGEPAADPQLYFEYVVAPLYGYALLIPGQLRQRAPMLAERFLLAVGAEREP